MQSKKKLNESIKIYSQNQLNFKHHFKMKKFNKINKEQILDLFNNKRVINRKDITDKYNCSVYHTRELIEDLKDDGVIVNTSYGYKKVCF